MLNFLKKYKQKFTFIKLNIENHFIKNYANYTAISLIFQTFLSLFLCYYYYKHFGQPIVSHNSGSSSKGDDPFFNLPELGPDPFPSLVKSILSGEITRKPLPCTRYTELSSGMYEVTGGAIIEIFKKDNVTPTKLVGIHIPTTSDLEGNKILGAKQVGCALFELKDKGVSAITSANTKNTPEVNEFVRAHSQFGGLKSGASVTISYKLIDGFVDMKIPKQD